MKIITLFMFFVFTILFLGCTSKKEVDLGQTRSSSQGSSMPTTQEGDPTQIITSKQEISSPIAQSMCPDVGFLVNSIYTTYYIVSETTAYSVNIPGNMTFGDYKNPDPVFGNTTGIGCKRGQNVGQNINYIYCVADLSVYRPKQIDEKGNIIAVEDIKKMTFSLVFDITNTIESEEADPVLLTEIRKLSGATLISSNCDLLIN